MCFARAALAVYGGHLAAFVTSPLAECQHCVVTFWQMLIYAPGVLATVELGGSDLQFLRPWLAGTVTLAALWGLAAMQRQATWLAHLTLLAAVLLAALNGTALGFALRM